MIDETTMSAILRDFINIAHDGSQSSAAAELGITPGMVSRMLAGKRPITANVADKLGYSKVENLYRIKS
jgi:plasmid maintenance system antidote protein VapI